MPSRALALAGMLALLGLLHAPARGLAQGDPFTIEVRATKIWRLYGMDLVVRFDPSQLTAVDLMPGTPGTQAAVGPGWGPAPFVASNEIDQVAGRARLQVTLLGPAQPVGGDLVLARLRFEPRRSPLEQAYAIEQVMLISPGGEEIPARWEGLVIEPLVDWRFVTPRAWLPVVRRGAP